MLSGASRDRPVIVGWSTALRGQVINEKSRATPEETGSRPAPAGKDQIITQRIGDETGWTTARSLGEVGATSVHSKPVFVCSDCTFRPGLLNRPFTLYVTKKYSLQERRNQFISSRNKDAFGHGCEAKRLGGLEIDGSLAGIDHSCTLVARSDSLMPQRTTDEERRTLWKQGGSSCASGGFGLA